MSNHILTAPLTLPDQLLPMTHGSSPAPLEISLPRSTAKAIAFIDQHVTDYGTLQQALAPDTISYQLQDGDAFSQITNILSNYHNLDSISIFSHGTQGALQLGNLNLDIAGLTSRRETLQPWIDALSPNADILLYGCNVASGQIGQDFVQALSHLTGADVAASDDLTGNAERGGDWQLEYHTGQIEAAAINPLNYSGTLATFTVNTLSDVVNPADNFLSLREAIINANQLTGDDTIRFNVNGTINLTQGELNIASNIRIAAPGPSQLTISGSNTSRIFNISTPSNVTIAGLTLKDARADNLSGGAIRNQGILTVQNAVFQNNFASAGGGIFNKNTLTVNGSTFNGNTAQSAAANGTPDGYYVGTGGAIVNSFDNGTSLNVRNSTFTNNAGGRGAAIDGSGNINITGSTFDGNENNAGYSADLATAIFVERGTTKITNSTLKNHISGYALSQLSGALTIRDSQFLNNYGAINLFYAPSADIRDSQFQDNNIGGAIVMNDASLTIRSSIFNRNVSTLNGRGGGAIYSRYNSGNILRVIDSTFDQNSAGSFGGAIHSGGELTVNGSRFTNNRTFGNQFQRGGAIAHTADQNAILSNNTITDNFSAVGGGGIYHSGNGTFSLRGNTISRNDTKDLLGTFVSLGNNTIGQGGGFTGLVNGVKGDKILVP